MKAIVSVLLVFVLGMVSCTNSTSTLITTLNAIADAASVAVAVTATLAAAGDIDPSVAAEVATYATATDAAVNTSITELNSSDSNAVKINVITAAFANVVAPVFDPSISPQLVAAIQSIVNVIELFVSQLNTPTTLTVAKVSSSTLVLTKGDRTLLKQTANKVKATDKAARLLK